MKIIMKNIDKHRAVADSLLVLSLVIQMFDNVFIWSSYAQAIITVLVYILGSV